MSSNVSPTVNVPELVAKTRFTTVSGASSVFIVTVLVVESDGTTNAVSDDVSSVVTTLPPASTICGRRASGLGFGLVSVTPATVERSNGVTEAQEEACARARSVRASD